jgi:hypothetical protein
MKSGEKTNEPKRASVRGLKEKKVSCDKSRADW